MTSESAAATKRAISALRKLPGQMLNIASQGADHLQRTDTYQNRTGNLRSGTQALLRYAEDAAIVDLEMDEFYASFVNMRGFSSFDQVAETVRDEINKGISALGKQATGD